MSRSVACIDYRNGKILIAKRIMRGDMGGRWEFPGGKIEEGEDYLRAIKREMQEEFGCDCQVFEELAQGSFFHGGKECSVVAFRVKLTNDGLSQPFTLTEHTQTAWVEPEKISKLNFVDSDINIFDQIKKSLGIRE